MRHGPLRRPVPNLRSLAIRHTLHAVFYTGAPDERGFGSGGWLHRGPRRARVWLGGVVTPGPPTSEGLARWGGYTGGSPVTTWTPGGGVNTKAVFGAGAFASSPLKSNWFTTPSVSSISIDSMVPSAAAVIFIRDTRCSSPFGTPVSTQAPLPSQVACRPVNSFSNSVCPSRNRSGDRRSSSVF